MLKKLIILAHIKYLRVRSGQAMTEYGLLIAIIAVAVITVLGLLSGGLQAAFQQIVDALPEAEG